MFANPRFLNFLVLITSLLGYIEWGVTQSSFMFQAEFDILRETGSNPQALFHPVILAPLLAQLILLVLMLTGRTAKWINLLGVSILVLFYLFLLLIGIMVPEVKTILSTLPLLFSSFFVYRFYFKSKGTR